MPARYSRRQDPSFRNVERWDDGYSPASTPLAPEADLPYYPPPPQPAGPSEKTAKYFPKYAMEDRDTRRRSPPPEFYDSDTPRRARHRSPRHRSPSPLRRSHRLRDESRDRHGRDGHHAPPASRYTQPRRPSIHGVRTMPDPVWRRVSPSPSPPPTNRRRHRDRDERPRSTSPPRCRRDSPVAPRRVKTTHDGVLPTAKSSGRGGASGAAHRPALARSKTTAAAIGRNAAEVLGSPRFQKAAAAALQAGGMAALRQWKAPGAWAGQKGASVATAALGAAAMDAFARTEAGGGTRAAPEPSSGGGGGKKAGISGKEVGSALGGLLLQHIVKGRGSKRGKR